MRSVGRSEEAQLLADAVRSYGESRLPLDDVRRMRDDLDPIGFSPKRWAEMIELGWPLLLVPDEAGGPGGGMSALGVVAEEFGRRLVGMPLVSTAMAITCALQSQDAVRFRLLTGLADGTTLVAVASQESAHHDPYRVETRAAADGPGFLLTGHKRFVADGHVADEVIVAARTSGHTGDRSGITLFLVDMGSTSVERSYFMGFDGRWRTHFDFDELLAQEDAVIGERDRGADLLDRAFDVGALLTAAELIGLATVTLDTTIGYLKDRRQFGVQIGSFQALQHRAARMWVSLELARSTVMDALNAFDTDAAEIEALVSAAKATANDASRLVTTEALQMHGGIGMTDEADVGLYLKRAQAASGEFGSSRFHRSRFAVVHGF